MAKNIEVRIVGDASGLHSTLDKTEGRVGKFGSVLQGIGQGIGQAFAGGVSSAVSSGVGLLQDSIGGASDLAETVSKTGVLFGESAGEVLEWSKTTAGALGQSRQQALDAASMFAVFGKTIGLSGGDLVDFSKNLTGLGADFSSFFNSSPEEAINAIGAALRGESEPIRKFGVLLSEDTLKATALSKGLIKAEVDTQKLSARQEAAQKASRKAAEALQKYGAESVEYTDAARDQQQAEMALAEVMEGKVPQLTQAQKMQAAYLSIMEQSTTAQGDFARTSDGLANKQRILAARFENVKAQIGTALLPAVLAVSDVVLTKVIPAFERFAGWVQHIADVFRNSGWKEAAKEILEKVGEAFSVLGAWIRDTAAPALWEALKSMAKALADWVRDPALPWLLEHLGQWLSAFGEWITGTAVPWLAGQVADLAVMFAAWVADSAKQLRDNLPIWLKTFSAWVVSEAIPAIIARAAEMAVKLADWVLTATAQMVANLPGWIASFTAWVATSAIPALINAGVAMAKAIAAGMRGSLNFMADIASAIVEGIIAGLWSLAGRMRSAVGGFIKSTIPDQVRGLLGINSPSKVMFELGRYSAEGLRLGMESGRFNVAAASTSVADSAYRAAARAGTAYTPSGMAGPTITLNGVIAGSETQLAAYLQRAIRTYNTGRR